MQFPNQWTAAIGPAIFLIIIIIIPIIGAKGGWKRAAYWGGCNLLFYIVGALVYRFAGMNISTALAPKFLDLLKSWGLCKDLTDATKVIPYLNGLLGPILFLVVFIAGNIILLINYYAWFKRVSGISRDSYCKKLIKKAKKDKLPAAKLDSKDKKVIKYKITNEHLAWVSSKKYKHLNRCVGLFGSVILMAPSVIALTQAATYPTVCRATLEDNSAAYGFHKVCKTINKNASWFSFYCGQSVEEDYDSLMSLLRTGTQLNPSWKNDQDGNYYWYDWIEQQGKIEFQWTPIDVKKIPNSIAAFNTCEGNCIAKLFEQICQVNGYIMSGAPTSEIEDQVGTLQTLANNAVLAWNQMHSTLRYDIQGLYGSEHLMSLIPYVITASSQTSIDSNTITYLTYGDTLPNLLAGLNKGGTVTICNEYSLNIDSRMERVYLNYYCEDVLFNILSSFYKIETQVEEEIKAFNTATKQFLYMFYHFDEE